MGITAILSAIEAALTLFPEAKAAISEILALNNGGPEPTPAEIEAAITASNARLAQAQADAGGPTLSI